MKVKELRDVLKNFDDDMEIMIKKTELFGTVSCVNNVKEALYYSFGEVFHCVVLTDEGRR